MRYNRCMDRHSPLNSVLQLIAGDSNIASAFREACQMNLPGDAGMMAWRDSGVTGSPVTIPAGPYDNA